MTTESRPREFHTMEFSHHDAAAAFVAALSRFLDSPKGDVFARPRSSVEVWARSAVGSEAVRLFLSDKALEMAEAAFSPVPVTKVVSRASLPAESFLIIEGGVTPAWGVEEASAKLFPR
jgi:hypothetical protein